GHRAGAVLREVHVVDPLVGGTNDGILVGVALHADFFAGVVLLDGRGDFVERGLGFGADVSTAGGKEDVGLESDGQLALGFGVGGGDAGDFRVFRVLVCPLGAGRFELLDAGLAGGQFGLHGGNLLLVGGIGRRDGG